MKKNDFELVPSSRQTATESDEYYTTPEYFGSNKQVDYGKQKLAVALADNMGNIIELARDIAEIHKMKVQTDVLKAAMDKKKELLLAEAEAYVQKKTIDNKAVVEQMEGVRLLLKDYYQYNVGKEALLSGEVFAGIISEVLKA